VATNRNHIELEKLTIWHMIIIYCRGHHHLAPGICGDCGSILRYANERIETCPYNGAPKPVCGLCRANCFTPDMYQRFALIMRYAGPRMVLRHPVLTIAHAWDAVRGGRGKV
jgi:predicted amidophosphoribosyltransferase